MHYHYRSHGRYLGLIPLLTLGAGVAVAWGGEFTPNAAAGVTYTDNVGRSATAKQDELMLGLQGGFRYTENTPRLDADVSGFAVYHYFTQNTFGDELVPRLRGEANLTLVPERINWEFQDNLGQIAAGAFGAITPADRQNINYLTTGPTFLLPLGGRTDLVTDLRASDVWYETSNADNRRYAGKVSLDHNLTRLQRVGVSYYYARTEFAHSDLYRPYDVSSATLHFNSTSRAGELSVEAGQTKVDTGTRSDQGTLFAVSLRRDIGHYTNLILEIHRDYADAADTFNFDQSGPITNLFDQNVQDRADPLLSRRDHVEVSYKRGRSFVRVLGEYSKEQYTNSFFDDRNITTAEIEFGWQVSPRTSLAASAATLRTRFQQTDATEDDHQYGLRLRYQMTPTLGLDTRIDRYTQSASQQITENRAYLGLTYTRTGSGGLAPSYRFIGGPAGRGTSGLRNATPPNSP